MHGSTLYTEQPACGTDSIMTTFSTGPLFYTRTRVRSESNSGTGRSEDDSSQFIEKEVRE